MKKLRSLSSGLNLVALATLGSLSQTAMAQLGPGGSAAKGDESTFTLGAGLGVGPRFMGSKENQVGPILLADYQHHSGFFASTMRGLGWGSDIGNFKYSLALHARGDRDEKDGKSGIGGNKGSKELRGMGKIKSSAVGLLNVGYQVHDRVGLSATLELPLTNRDNGRALHLGSSIKLFETDKDSFSLDASASYGDTKYLRTYFGVTAAQSAASGYKLYAPKSGFYQADVSLAWHRQIDKRWGIIGSIGATHLLGDAGKSPLALRKTAPQAGVIVTYNY
ncbi:MipA/OmpV family protein [Roseateles sp. DAIF2]|uniref:MipA/OmpV family protein n=1 Tax=Roseateles sp. DAIF2 TaxID=2714952 RepID=UPI0018A2AEB1|nr:MipA/OmpV family protein [Roseateles sp. DAIF2]QPF75517.1 MipA/OmpV family protein [Roseateles sp. DAIF2]